MLLKAPLKIEVSEFGNPHVWSQRGVHHILGRCSKSKTRRGSRLGGRFLKTHPNSRIRKKPVTGRSLKTEVYPKFPTGSFEGSDHLIPASDRKTYFGTPFWKECTLIFSRFPRSNSPNGCWGLKSRKNRGLHKDSCGGLRATTLNQGSLIT